MSSIKKRIPLAILPQISDILLKHQNKVLIRDNPSFMLFLQESDPSSEFHFMVQSMMVDGQYVVYRKPGHMGMATEKKFSINIENIPAALDTWFECLEGYSESVTIFDDPIVNKYTDEFLVDLRFDEPEADYESFNLKEQIYLTEYLSNVQKVLEVHKENTSEERVVEIKEIEIEVEELQTQLTGLSKNQVAKKLSHIWAKSRRFSLPLLKEVVQEFKKEVIKTLIKSTLEIDAGSVWTLVKGILPPP